MSKVGETEIDYLAALDEAGWTDFDYSAYRRLVEKLEATPDKDKMAMSTTYDALFVRNPAASKFQFYYITYGCGTNLAGCYSVVKAQDYVSMRQAVHALIGQDFAFVYCDNEFEGQIKEYGLRRVPLQRQVKNEDS